MLAKLQIHQAFLDMLIPAAVAEEKLSKVPAEVTVGQAILESNWGRSKLAVIGQNLFGIKADPTWAGKTVSMPTSEYISNKWIHTVAVFKQYPDYLGSIKDHAKFLQKNRYKKAFMHTNDWKLFLEEIWRAGYATDPKYVEEVISVLSPGILSAISAARLPVNTETQVSTNSTASAQSESLFDRIARYCGTYFRRG